MLAAKTSEVSGQVASAKRVSVEYVHGLRFDLIFFLAPFWASLVYMGALAAFPAHEALVFVLAYVLLQETHFASTWTVYLDSRNREQYAQRRSVYYWVPLAIMVGCVLLAWSVSLKLVMLVGAVASAIHVTRQSTGIVGLYRNKARQFDPAQKKWENLTLYLASATFLGVGFLRFYLAPEAGYGAIVRVLGPVATLLRDGVVVLAVGAVFALARVVALEVTRVRAGGTLSMSKLVVFAYSVFLYSPYLFATRMEHAVAIGVSVHFVQYLGIVWLLNGNKYKVVGSKAPVGERVLGWLSQKLWVRLPYLLFYALVMAYLRQGGFQWDHLAPASWLYSIPIALQITHYHLDAFLWRFSNPYIRATVLPYLKRMDS
jgi:hypothetical protein